MRLPRSLNEPTCKITDIASTTKIPPTKNSKISCLMITAIVPSAPPSPSDPTSPMKISAGCALYQRNPNEAPTSAPQNTVSSPAAITVQPIANPSSPSVKFTAFELPVITTAINTKNGTNANGHKCG